MTGIEWTDETWNPLAGCTIHSAGCTNCYAMKMAARLEAMGSPVYQGLTKKTKAGPVWTGKVNFSEKALLKPLRWKKPRKIFVNSMSDLFHEDVPDEWIDRVFAVMALCPQHSFQLLTKRSGRMREYCSDPATPFRVARSMAKIINAPDGPEEFRPVERFPSYIVSSHGHVYSEKRGKRKRLRPDAGEQGHLRVPLFREGGPRRGERMSVHRLVLCAFKGSPPSENAQGRHLDGDPRNNAIGNLIWGDQAENWQDSKAHGSFRRYSKLTEAQVAEIRERGGRGEAAYSIAKDFPVSDTQVRNILTGEQWSVAPPLKWPLATVWLGVSVEDQRTADERIPDLEATPAAVIWISAEPMLGQLELGELNVDWVVCGGESGPGSRPMHPDWARSLRDQCAAAGVKFLFKQHGDWVALDADGGEWPTNTKTMCRLTVDGKRADDGHPMQRVGKGKAGRLLDGVLHDGYPGDDQ
jgi:protein gp37